MPKAKFERVSTHHNISDLRTEMPSQPRLKTLAALEKYYKFLEKLENSHYHKIWSKYRYECKLSSECFCHRCYSKILFTATSIR